MSAKLENLSGFCKGLLVCGLCNTHVKIVEAHLPIANRHLKANSHCDGQEILESKKTQLFVPHHAQHTLLVFTEDEKDEKSFVSLVPHFSSVTITKAKLIHIMWVSPKNLQK